MSVDSTEFEGKGVVVIGAASGIGRGVAAGFAEQGATVVVVDLNGERAAGVAAELGSGASGMACDVADPEQVAATVAACEERLGGIDVLCSCAGVLTANPLVAATDREWDLMMNVNARGVFNAMRAALPGMVGRGSGSIVNIASVESKQVLPELSIYCASKAAVLQLTRAAALEAAPAVRVNCVCPGVIRTEMMEAEFARAVAAEGVEREVYERRWLDRIPIGRFLEPADVADAVIYLSSTRAASMTGQAINVAGGMLMD
jgi:meso-butanediol dehydrogenase / (S,S)-butanediol dehydrogenase / diacetyl reductase